MVTASDSSHRPHPAAGTPVVPGVAHGPALRRPRRGPPAAVAAFGAGGFADAEAALAAYDEAVDAVADGFARKAAKASGAAAEVLTASAGLARDKGLRGAVAQAAATAATTCSPRCAGPSTSSSALFTGMGGLMAERVTDLRDIERRVIARARRRARARRPDSRPSRRCWSPRTSRPPTPPGWTRPWWSAW